MRLFIRIIFTGMIATVLWVGSAVGLEGLQVMELKGKMVGPTGAGLGEFDYLEPGQKYRLMPGAEVELSSLDGQKSWRAKGPGVISFEASGQVSLNGQPLAAGAQGGVIGSAASGGGNKMAAVAMRGQDGILVQARNAYGRTGSVRLYSGYYALVIGAGEYANGWPRLPNPVKDADEVAGLLKSLDWRVRVVKNPTGRELRQALNSLITGPGKDPDMAVLVWFSGHGHTLKEVDGSKLGYIVPVDAPDPAVDEMGFMEKAVSMRQVETVARRIMSKHVLMMFDSCFSGALFQITRAKPSPFIEEKVAKPVRLFVTAGNENEQVPDKSQFKTVFLQAVQEGYADRNKDGYITGQEMGAYLQEKVINYSRKAQHPQYGKINNPKLDKGDFVFVVKKEEPPARPAAAPAKESGPKVAVAAPARQTQGSSRSVAAPARPKLSPTDRQAVLAALKKWHRAYLTLDVDAMMAHFTGDASIAVRVKGDKFNLGRDEYAQMMTVRARRMSGRFKRKILEVVQVEGGGGQAQAQLKTRQVGPGGGAVILERFQLVKSKGTWLIAQYRFNKLEEIKQQSGGDLKTTWDR